MKSLITYYLVAIFFPLLIFIFLFFNNNNEIFVILLILYALIYRPIIDGNRLIKKGVIKKNEFWKLFIGYAHIKWFSELYLKK
jgi:hypothetical protein